MNLPSRGLRESATTSRYTGRLVVPIRFNLILTNVVLLSETCLSELRGVDVLELSEHAGLAADTLGAFAAEAFEHALHLFEALEQTVDVRDRRAAAHGNAFAARALDELGMTALLHRHREDDRLHAAEILLRRHGGSGLLDHLATAGEHAEHAFERAHAAQLTELREPIVHGETSRKGALHHLLGFLLVELLLRALDEREDVAHAENARGHPVGRERLEVGDL